MMPYSEMAVVEITNRQVAVGNPTTNQNTTLRILKSHVIIVRANQRQIRIIR
jgi:hypothetical protein